MSNDKLEEAVSGFAEAKQKGLVQSTKESIQGWRDIGGMDVGMAALIDIIFLALGGVLWIQGGMAQWGGLALVFFGAIGLLEKIGRRVI